MKWRYIFAAVVAFAVALAAKWWWRGPKHNVSSAARFSQVITDKVSPAKVSQVREFVEAQSAGQTQPETCVAAREKLLRQKIDEIVRDIVDRRSQLDASCVAYDAALTSEDLASAVYKNCAREDLIAGRNVEACWQALMFFKATLVANAYGRAELDKADTETLIYLFMAEIARGNFRTPEDYARLNDLSDHLIEAMPDSPSAHKAAAISRILADFENMSAGKALNPEVDQYIQQALRMDQSDAELEEIAMFRRIYDPGAKKLSVEKAQALAESQPGSTKAQYFLGAAYAQFGRRKEALMTIQDIVAREPENQRYKETLEKLRRGDKTAFALKLGLSFERL